MRKLIGKDLITVARIIKKSKVKEELANIFGSTEDVQKVGVKALLTIIEACGEQGVDDEIFVFLNDILGVENTSSMNLFELVGLIKEFMKENDVKSFLSIVGQSM